MVVSATNLTVYGFIDNVILAYNSNLPRPRPRHLQLILGLTMGEDRKLS